MSVTRQREERKFKVWERICGRLLLVQFMKLQALVCNFKSEASLQMVVVVVEVRWHGMTLGWFRWWWSGGVVKSIYE